MFSKDSKVVNEYEIYKVQDKIHKSQIKSNVYVYERLNSN